MIGGDIWGLGTAGPERRRFTVADLVRIKTTIDRHSLTDAQFLTQITGNRPPLDLPAPQRAGILWDDVQ